MILIADGGSTKVDWIAINNSKEEVFRVKTLGLNPAVVKKEELRNRIVHMFQLMNIKDDVSEIHFYGAGCGTPKPVEILRAILESIFVNAKVFIDEDMLAAVYASTKKKPGLVCILGTGSNSCYFDGEKVETKVPSLGYTLMDEASGNYFGKLLIRDYYYKKMPKRIAKEFEKQFNLEADFIKMNLYRESNPNMYLASFAKFMFDFKEDKYIKKIIKKGFQEIIEKKKARAEQDLALLKAAYKNDADNGTDDTSPSFKSFDEGSDVMNKEANVQLAIRQEKFIRDLNNALLRIENGTYGV